MTERFTETISTGVVTDNKTGIEYSCEMRIDDDFLHLINNIAEEREQLKRKVNFYKYFQKDARELDKENEQLKADKQSLIDFIRKEFPKSYKHILEGFND